LEQDGDGDDGVSVMRARLIIAIAIGAFISMIFLAIPSMWTVNAVIYGLVALVALAVIGIVKIIVKNST